MHSIGLAHIRRFVFSVLFGSFCILALLAVLGGVIRAASLDSPGTGLDPEIRYITMTSHLPLYDPTGGEGITKTVFFNNTSTGVITLTFEISGTPALTLTAGAAFGDAAQTYTSAETPWLQEVAYSVEAGGGDYPGVAYTVTNSEGQRATVAITYVRDIVGPYHVYLPVAVRNYVPFANGSFESGWIPWQRAGELNQSRTQAQAHEGQWSVMLGDSVYYNPGGVPVGSGRVWQTFSVPGNGNPKVTMWYRIYTHDVVWGVETGKYYDSFEVYINTVNWSEANNPDPGDPWRETRCRDNLGVPDTSVSGLVFCDGNPSDPSETNPAKDLGWRSVTLDLGQFKGQNIILYLAAFNRVDGWFNTWAYIDDIQLDE